MIPLHFGTRQRLLFGLWNPSGRARRRHGVVICNPWGEEAVRAHRTLRILAERLARTGLDVLRFDYFGTGDSLGSSTSVTLTGCVDDTIIAIEEVSTVANVDSVSLIGLRMGAAIAGQAARAGSSVIERLVLWDPLSTGDGEGIPAARPHPRPADEASRRAAQGTARGAGAVLVVRSEGGGRAPPCWQEEAEFGAGAVASETIERIGGWFR